MFFFFFFFSWNYTLSNLDHYIFVADMKINAVNPDIKMTFLKHKFICREGVIHPPELQFKLSTTFLSIPFFFFFFFPLVVVLVGLFVCFVLCFCFLSFD